ncbi:MAG: aspartate/glutamate racemase family protein [Bacteroidales bacterium]|nr:aspartate/glutamate racemase family protein [Bacteroidales bacterium]
MKKLKFRHQLTVLMACIGLLPLNGFFCNTVHGQTDPNKKVKVALIYTVTTPELKEDMEREVKEQLGANVEVLRYEVPSVFEDIKKADYVTAIPAATLIGTYMKAIESGADAILSICSTVEDIAYSMQDAAKYLGVPIIMINEEMCREAVRKGTKIAVMATFPTAIAPTKRTLTRVSREMGKQIEITEVLLDGAFGLDQKKFKALMAAKAGEIAGKVDVIIFAQGSMAYCEGDIANMYQKIVLSNPRFGAKALKSALIKKGVIFPSLTGN